VVAKCANPLCFNPFRRLGKGTLFRLETDPLLWASKYRAPEYFWLCDRCCAAMTLCIGSNGSVETRALSPSGAHLAVPAFPAVSRREGMWLYSISLLRGQGEDEAA
jgi:hypothetical protein